MKSITNLLRRWKKIINKTLPKKHGAWSILFISIITGTLCSKRFKIIPFLLLFIPSFFTFLLRENISLFLKLRKGDERRKEILEISYIYFIITIFTFLPLLIIYKYYLLIVIGSLTLFIALFSFYFSINRQELTVPSEILGILGLSLLLPSFYYISKEAIDKSAIFLFIFTFLFFKGSVFHVRYLVRNKNILSEKFSVRLKASKVYLLYHTFFLLLLLSLYLSYNRFLPPLSFISVLPTFFKSYFFLLRKFEKPLSLKKIGLTELILSIIFVILIIFAYLTDNQELKPYHFFHNLPHYHTDPQFKS